MTGDNKFLNNLNLIQFAYKPIDDVECDTYGNKQHMHLSLSTLSLLATTPLTFLCLPGETYLA